MRRVVGAVVVLIALLLPPGGAGADHSFADLTDHPVMPRPMVVTAEHPEDQALIGEYIRPWNVLAGKPVFVEQVGSVVIRRSTGTRAWTEMADGQCTIHLPAGSTVALARHELGHCLGFADHVPTGTVTTHYDNPRFCNGPDRSPYRGVMSYCWNLAFTTWDLAAMRGGWAEARSAEPALYRCLAFAIHLPDSRFTERCWKDGEK